MKNNKVQQSIIDKIKNPILLSSIFFGLIVSGLGIYSHEKLSKLIIPLVTVYIVGLLVFIIHDIAEIFHHTQKKAKNKTSGLYFVQRKDILNNWIEIVEHSEELTIVNGISRKYITDIETMSLLKKYLSKCHNATIIWDSKFNQATRFFQIKEIDEDYKIVDLKKHLDEKITYPLNAFSDLKRTNPSMKVKILPFPVSYTFIKIDTGIYVTFLGAVRGSNGPTLFIEKSNKNFYSYFKKLIDNIVNLSADVEYDVHNQTWKISEFLQLVDEHGRLLTTLPREFIEDLNYKFNEKEKKNLAHRHVYCLVVSPEGKLLIQKRGKRRDNGGLWDKSVGGHVQYEETMVDACIREVDEELGVKVNFENHELSLIDRQVQPVELARILYRDGKYENSIEYSSYELFLLYGVQEYEIKINTFEVSDYKWIHINKVDEFINKHNEKTTEDLKKLTKSIDKILVNKNFSI